MPIGTLTYTGSTGPGGALTTQVFNNVTNIDFDFARGTVRVVYNSGRTTIFLSFGASTTVTWTVSGGNSTITVS